MKKNGPAILFLAIYATLMLNASWRLSPTWDEIVYPAAGVAQWKTGAIDLNLEHPYLSKLLAALPLLALRPTVAFDDPAWAARDGYRFGYQFTFHNRVSARWLIFWSRVPAVFFSTLTGLLLFLWVRTLWGLEGGLMSLVCYATTPILSSRASLALLEAPMYFFMLLSLWLHRRSEQTNGVRFVTGSGIALGLALLCKFPALPLLPCYFLLDVRNAWQHRRWQPLSRFIQLIGVAALTWAGAFLPWRHAGPAMRMIGWNLMHFDTILPYYWHGAFLAQAPSLLSWAAFAIKAPPFVLALGAWGGWAAWKAQAKRDDLMHWLCLTGCCLMTVLFFRGAVTTIQLSPLYLAVAGCAGFLGRRLRQRLHLASVLIFTLVTAASVDAWCIHPNYLSYFSPLVGGAAQGYRWLGDSDQDWGQSLPALAQYAEDHGSPNLLLAYSGAADPRAYRLRFQDLLSPALFARDQVLERIGDDRRPVWIALATKVLQTEPRFVGWLRQSLKPQALVGDCFLIYDVTRVPDAYRWMGAVYAATHRPAEARWAFARAQALEPENSIDRESLRRLPLQ